MNKLLEFKNNKKLKIIIGGLIIALLLIGSLNDLYDFTINFLSFKFGIITLFLIFLLGLGYSYLDNKEIRDSKKGVVPDLDLVCEFELKVEKLKKFDELNAIHKLAVDAFKENAMPYELISKLHWLNRQTVYLLKHSKEGIIGYISLFFPNNKLKEEIFNGTTDPLEWDTINFIEGESIWNTGHIYLESTVVLTPFQTERFCILLDFVAKDIENKVIPYLRKHDKIQIFGLAANINGKNLMQRTLRMNSVMFANERNDGMELFNDFKTFKEIIMLKKKIEAIKNNFILTKQDII